MQVSVQAFVRVCACSVTPLGFQLFATLWIAARQAPLSVGFSRQECWSKLPCPPPGDLPNLGIKPVSSALPALQADSLSTEPPGKPTGVWLGLNCPGFGVLFLAYAVTPPAVAPTLHGALRNCPDFQSQRCWGRCTAQPVTLGPHHKIEQWIHPR